MWEGLEFFFFFFFGVTYSCVFKKQKGNYSLAMAAFLKNAAIGRPQKNLYVGPMAAFFQKRGYRPP